MALQPTTYLIIMPGLEYPETQFFQRFCLEYVRRGTTCSGLIILTSHPPCYTVGKALRLEDVPQPLLWPVYPSERGGKLTFHHPGQLVCYPIIKLTRPDVLAFMKQVLEWGNLTLASLGLEVRQNEDETGVWVNTPLRPNGRGKVASLGLAVKHWVSYHGLAINHSVPPAMWEGLPQGVHPCGLSQDAPFNLIEACPELALHTLQEQFIETLYADATLGCRGVYRLTPAKTAQAYWQQVQKLLQ